MNATERDQLQQFLAALRQTQVDAKDPVADDLIRASVALQADAPYLLVQRSMALGLALDAAQSRIEQLQAQCAEQQVKLAAQAQAAKPANGGFLSSGAQSWGRGAETPAPVARPNPSAAPMSASAAAPQASAWGGGLMAQVATTAAGVVAGGLLFQGVQNLMGNKPAAPSDTSHLSSATDGSLPGQVSSAEPLGVADAGDAADGSWDAGDDWA